MTQKIKYIKKIKTQKNKKTLKNLQTNLKNRKYTKKFKTYITNLNKVLKKTNNNNSKHNHLSSYHKYVKNSLHKGGGKFGSMLGSLAFREYTNRNSSLMPASLKRLKRTLFEKQKPQYLSIVYGGTTNRFDISKYTSSFIPHSLVSSEPEIQLKPAARHLLILYDMDWRNKNGVASPLLNWACVVKFGHKSGISIINYLPPSPPIGIHRYKFELFLYPENLNYRAETSDPVDRTDALKKIYTFIQTNKLIKRIVRFMKCKKVGTSSLNVMTFFANKTFRNARLMKAQK
jgi:hypothetical protein